MNRFGEFDLVSPKRDFGVAEVSEYFLGPLYLSTFCGLSWDRKLRESWFINTVKTMTTSHARPGFQGNSSALAVGLLPLIPRERGEDTQRLFQVKNETKSFQKERHRHTKANSYGIIKPNTRCIISKHLTMGSQRPSCPSASHQHTNHHGNGCYGDPDSGFGLWESRSSLNRIRVCTNCDAALLLSGFIIHYTVKCDLITWLENNSRAGLLNSGSWMSVFEEKHSRSPQTCAAAPG